MKEAIPDTVENVFLLGIGGIGMSALARYFLHRQKTVAGYDRAPSAITEELEKQGIQVLYKDDVSALPSWAKEVDISKTLIIYTPAVKEDNNLMQYFRDVCVPLLKRAEVLGMIARRYRNIAVAGTHGKTTTTSALAHIFFSASMKALAFSGGIMTNYNTNFLDHPEAEWLICEADEFDRSFLTLSPQAAIITSAEPDHLDIYHSVESLHKAFGEFVERVSPQGILLINDKFSSMVSHIHRISYGFSREADARIISFAEQGTELSTFTIQYGHATLGPFRTSVPGRHNMENLTAAIMMARWAGIEEHVIQEAIATFKGVKRRFEYVVKNDSLIWIDDYAHHPTEIKALLDTVRMKYPGKKITAIFQPHLYSRTRDFLDDFAKQLDRVNLPVLLPVYPAREKPQAGCDSEQLLKKMKNPKACLVSKKELEERIRYFRNDIILTIGAGDIDKLIPVLLKKIWV